MAIPSSGAVSASMIRTELNIPSQVPFSLFNAELLRYIDLNTLSISTNTSSTNYDLVSPNIDYAMSMSEWRGYNHTLTASFSTYSYARFKAPITSSYYLTFAQIDMGTTSMTASITGSQFVTSGLSTISSVSYSIYYATYSSNIRSKNLIRKGVLSEFTPINTFNYEYNPSSGSTITILFSNDRKRTTPLLKYDAYSSSFNPTGSFSNVGSLGATYNLTNYTGSKGYPISKGGTGNGVYIMYNTSSNIIGDDAELGRTDSQASYAFVSPYYNTSPFQLNQKDYSISLMFSPVTWSYTPSDILDYPFYQMNYNANSIIANINYNAGENPEGYNTGIFLGLSGSVAAAITGAINIASYNYPFYYANVDNSKTQLFRNTWSHVVRTYTYETNTAKLFVNNTLISTFQPSYNIGYEFALYVTLGNSNLDGLTYYTYDPIRWVRGFNSYGGFYLGQFSLYDSALTTDEINDLYSEFSIRYSPA